jgi:homocysteine S-methyltransferase
VSTTLTAPAHTVHDLIADGRVHVLDGAMGTLLYGRGVFVNVCYDELSVTRPDLVSTVHQEYVQAGAEILETNTFGANPVKLSSWGLEDRTEELNREAARLARRAAAGRALVAGAIGPLGIRIEPWGPTSIAHAEALFQRQIAGLCEGGVDAFVLETFSDPAELAAAFRAVRALSAAPVIAQMTVGEDGKSSYGAEVEHLAAELDQLGADVIGLNCSVGPAAMLDALERMARVTRKPLSAQPNAGVPRTVRDRKIYLASPDYMGAYARRLIDAGARFVGGCCGTTPEHVRRIRDVVTTFQPRDGARRGTSVGVRDDFALPEVPLTERSELGTKLAGDDFLSSAELLPPLGWDAIELVAAARRLSAAGVDVVHVLDSTPTRSRMASVPAGIILAREGQFEPVVHYGCRDRNMPGMLSDLLGAAAAGIRNVLVLSGDPPRQGPYPDQTVMFDIDSIGLINVLTGLNHGLDPGGTRIGEPTRFVVGTMANPGALDLDREVERFGYKVDAGADFAVTQPVFELAALERFLALTERWPVPVLVAVWPLASLRNAEFFANEVPGAVVPDAVVERMRRAGERGPEAARAEGIAIAQEVAAAVRRLGPPVRGIHVAAPGGDVDAALAVLGR